MSKIDEAKRNLDVFLEIGSNAVIFIKFRFLLEELARRADNGDEAAIEIVDRVSQVAELITYANSRNIGEVK